MAIAPIQITITAEDVQRFRDSEAKLPESMLAAMKRCPRRGEGLDAIKGEGARD